MKKKYSNLKIKFICCFVLVCSLSNAQTELQDLQNIKVKYLTNLLSESIITDETVQSYKDNFIEKDSVTTAYGSVGGNDRNYQTNGTWKDLITEGASDYASDRASSWPGTNHLKRCYSLAQAFATPTHNSYKDAEIKRILIKALGNWADENYGQYAKSFVNQAFRVPDYTAKCLLLIQSVDVLPQDIIDKTSFLLDIRDKKIGFTGANRVWSAQSAIPVALFREKTTLLKDATDAVWETIVFQTGVWEHLPNPVSSYTLAELKASISANSKTLEGLQPDWSFLQHGPMVQFGMYGLDFAVRIVPLADLFSNSYVAMPEEKIEFLRGYLIKGSAWTIWKGKMDYNLLGRLIRLGKNTSRGEIILSNIEKMKAIDPAHAAEYDLRLAPTNQLIGFKSFWRADLAISRGQDYYASVKMSSNRVTYGESLQQRNMQGFHQSDGVMMFKQRDSSFVDMGAIWDWQRLPGTTTDQKISSLIHRKRYQIPQAPNTFAGSAGLGKYGVAAMKYVLDYVPERGDASLVSYVEAKKAWFFDEDAIVCLGSDINGTPQGDVYTSIQQTRMYGNVTSSSGNLAMGTHTIADSEWVHHDGAGYQLVGADATVKAESVNGKWSSVVPAIYKKNTDSEILETADVFSMWADHGNSPSNAEYEYYIYPNATLADMANRVANRPTVLSNTDKIQAIEKDGRAYMVFYEAGSLTLGDGRTVTVDEPCLLIIKGQDVVVSDPNHALASINITIDADAKTINLPSQPGYVGQQLSFTTTALSVDDVNNPFKQDKLRLYNDYIEVVSPENASGFELYNIQGQLLKQYIKTVPNKIYTNTLPRGVYIVRLREHDNRNYAAKFLPINKN